MNVEQDYVYTVLNMNRIVYNLLIYLQQIKYLILFVVNKST